MNRGIDIGVTGQPIGGETHYSAGRGFRPWGIGWGVVIASVLGILAVVLVLTAWMHDDAYITFRTIDNFVNGYGLTWNVAERVQAYTNPLWMFLVTLVYLCTREVYFSSIALSLGITLLAAAIVSLRVSTAPFTAVLVLLGLLASKPFIDFSTSGLENPLTHLLLIVFFAKYFTGDRNRGTLMWLSFVAALSAINRLDTILLYLPALLFCVVCCDNKKNAWVILPGVSPLFLWLAFATFYYGSPFPNSAFAKLSAGIDSPDLAAQGWIYLKSGFSRSPVTLIAMAGAVAAAVYARSAKLIVGSLGILLYIGYVVRVGGDYMEGRFLAAPFVMAITFLSQHRFRPALTEGTMIAGTALVIGLVWPTCPLRSGMNYGADPSKFYWNEGIADEREGYYQKTGLLVQSNDQPIPNHPWVREGLDARLAGKRVVTRAGIGFFGFFAGPQVHVVDYHGLSDPLLARLPTMTPKKWRIGHFIRPIPEGYIASLESGDNVLTEELLREYYGRLRFITRGNLWDWTRLKTIVDMNLGRYEHLIQSYVSQPVRVRLSDFRHPRPQGTPYRAPGNMLLRQPGLVIDMEELRHTEIIELSSDSNDEYLLEFLRDSTVVASHVVPIRRIPEGGLRVDTIYVPREAFEPGFNFVHITGQGGDMTYSVGHLRLLR
ncbi:MAG: hypothetical protein AB1772_02600 [Candidatus Zixiibacteriota bacterium]